jgi:hypothetical protein
MMVLINTVQRVGNLSDTTMAHADDEAIRANLPCGGHTKD